MFVVTKIATKRLDHRINLDEKLYLKLVTDPNNDTKITRATTISIFAINIRMSEPNFRVLYVFLLKMIVRIWIALKRFVLKLSWPLNHVLYPVLNQKQQFSLLTLSNAVLTHPLTRRIRVHLVNRLCFLKGLKTHVFINWPQKYKIVVCGTTTVMINVFITILKSCLKICSCTKLIKKLKLLDIVKKHGLHYIPFPLNAAQSLPINRI